MNKTAKSILIIILVMFFASCAKNDPSLNATRLRISITDEPMSTRADSVYIISEYNVDIQKIEVSATDSTGNNEEWTTLDFNGGTYNILPLTNGTYKQIADQYFPAGILRRIKVYYGDNSSVKVNGNTKRIILNPEFSNGVIYEVNANLYANYISNILIDINARLSFYEQNGNYFFKPVARVFAETYGGTLKGNVLPAEANPAVFVVNNKDTLLTFPETKDGMFKILGLDEGVWDIYILAGENTEYRDSIFSDTIYSGKTTELKSITLKKITIPDEGGEDPDDPENPDDGNGGEGGDGGDGGDGDNTGED